MNCSAMEIYVRDKRVEGQLCTRLLSLETDLQQTFAALIEAINPSGNTLRDLLRLADEISARDRLSLNALLTSEFVVEILSSSISRKQRTTELRRVLEEKRYPEVALIRTKLNQAQRKLAVVTGLRVNLPDDLEGEKLTVTVSARSPEEFAELGEKFKLLATQSETKELFAVLRGEL